MSKAQTIERIIFYLALLFLPTQLGRHFWPEFSHVLGVRVDYLSPTLYLSDILVVFLLLFSFGRKVYKKSLNFKFQFRFNRIQISNFKFAQWLFLFFTLFLVIGILRAKNPMAGWYGLLRFFEFFFFGLYVVKQKISFAKIALVFSFGVVFESFLALAQYFQKGSMGGLFYFFGERAFTSQTPGIANASINGELMLRPYGTFPHPNVLGGYLIIAMVMVMSNVKCQMSNVKRALLFSALVVGTGALILTMSRIAILLWLAVVLFTSLKKLQENFKKRRGLAFLFLLPMALIFAVSFFFPLKARLFGINLADEPVVERIALMKTSLLMIKDHPFFGVGLNNFLVNLPSYLEKPVDIFNLQPVHNIYLLIAAENGIPGFVFFLWFIKRTYDQIKNKKSMVHNSLFLILSLVLVLGFFDHYFLTLQQGRMLLSFALGLCWAKSLNS
ncbi:MAG: O-antigen ligase family protein [Candidatus Levybacteria bacterium]|nr:O-antigen ligase family protein [Candidatus Levybacteria bacterium]